MLNGSIAVVFGGVSNESEISVITGTMCANVLKGGGAKVIPVYISAAGAIFCGDGLADIEVFRRGEECNFPRCFIADGGLQVLGRRGRIKKFIPLAAAINCCHGGLGEGGGIGGVFACAGIPLAGGDIFSASAFLNKHYAKIVLRGLGVKILPYFAVSSLSDLPAAIKKTGLPAIVKPACLGSSIGIVKAVNEEEYAAAIESALCYDSIAVCERYVENRREVNCAACMYGGEVHISECEEAISSGGLLSFDDKYSGGGRSVIPADIPEELSERIKDITRNVYSELDMRGIARFDFILEGEQLFLSEVNTVPGSLAWYLFAPAFKEFYPVLEGVILQAVVDFKLSREKLILKTGILKTIPVACGKLK